MTSSERKCKGKESINPAWVSVWNRSLDAKRTRLVSYEQFAKEALENLSKSVRLDTICLFCDHLQIIPTFFIFLQEPQADPQIDEEEEIQLQLTQECSDLEKMKKELTIEVENYQKRIDKLEELKAKEIEETNIVGPAPDDSTQKLFEPGSTSKEATKKSSN